MLDGRTSAYDWEPGQTVKISDLARSINPEKGYLASANNRQTSDNVLHDYSLGNPSTTRIQRISDMIEEGIKMGKKFTHEDMNRMQLDVVDIAARDIAP